jgi:hypothetical protein
MPGERRGWNEPGSAESVHQSGLTKQVEVVDKDRANSQRFSHGGLRRRPLSRYQDRRFSVEFSTTAKAWQTPSV